jgi:uncharacterized membrane protein
MILLLSKIVVPNLSSPEDANELPKRLLELGTDIWIHATSFMILEFFWIAPDDQFQYIKRGDRTLFWTTLFFLIFIAFIPFSNSD